MLRRICIHNSHSVRLLEFLRVSSNTARFHTKRQKLARFLLLYEFNVTERNLVLLVCKTIA